MVGRNSFYYSKTQSILLQTIKTPFSTGGFMMRKKKFCGRRFQLRQFTKCSNFPGKFLKIQKIGKSENSSKNGISWKIGKIDKNRKTQHAHNEKIQPGLDIYGLYRLDSFQKPTILHFPGKKMGLNQSTQCLVAKTTQKIQK